MVMLLYSGGSLPPGDVSSLIGPYSLVDLITSALQKAATETLAVSLLRFARTRCSTLLNLPLLTSCQKYEFKVELYRVNNNKSKVN